MTTPVSLQAHVPVIALAGNPNTGKTTLFNRLTGLRQHTGNWPGKTVLRAEGHTQIGGELYRVVDLPGTYTLSGAGAEESVARDFVCFGRPDVTIVVADATALARNLSLVLQVLEMTTRVVVAVNLMDEARRKGINIDLAGLAARLGVPVFGISARTGEGVAELLEAVAAVAAGRVQPTPMQLRYSAEVEAGVERLLPLLAERPVPGVSPRWLALRLLEGDRTIEAGLEEYVGPVALPWAEAEALIGEWEVAG